MAQASNPLNILEVMDGIAFPVTKTELVQYAIDNDASEDVLDQLHAMPEMSYGSMRDINAHLGEIEDLPNTGGIWESDDLELDEEVNVLPDGTDHIVGESQ